MRSQRGCVGLHPLAHPTSLASQDHFREAGNVLHADVVMDPEGKSRGFGTVRYGTTNHKSPTASPPSL
jgi:hypothetical protein